MDIHSALQQLDWNRAPKGLYEPIGYALSAGGKRMRPQLALLACRIFGGNEQEVMPAALALEVFHNFTLLHDDVMDHAKVRRGRPCVHVRWNENTAILSGDQMLIEAYKLLAQVPKDKLSHTLELFNQMATGICEGQQYDVDFETQEQVTLEDYMQMIRLKTAVLLGTALEIGGYIAGADEQHQHTLYEIGITLGLAFQIEDDYLDCFGDEKTFGKAIGGDILEGKKTYMRLMAEKLDPTFVYRKDIEWITNQYREIGVDTVARKTIQQTTDQALDLIQKLPQNDATQQLREMAQKLATRNL